MEERQLGAKPKRYSFVLNQYSNVRLSKCPTCERPTHPRKFAFFVHAEGYGPLVMGKTSRYCSRCEIIIVHQDEMDREMSTAMDKLKPDAVGKAYLVLGTVEKNVWKNAMLGKEARTLDEAMEFVSQFKTHLKLEVTGGWGHWPAEK